MEDPRAHVRLVAVDDDVLDRLVVVATTRASADEVTPPLTPGSGWTPRRLEWLRSYHRDRRQGLDGPHAEATWAVLVDDRVAGSVRLRRTGDEGVVETGLWLARDVRGRGLGTATLTAVLDKAGELGAEVVRADTLDSNVGALGALGALGFALTAGEGRAVRAVVSVPPGGTDAGRSS